jgi:SAM-dependent methyltransferase
MVRIRPDWPCYLHARRAREIDLIFGRCPDKLFATGLELGAGDGFQSRLLTRYISNLVSTDSNPRILECPGNRSVQYLLCDAEQVDEMFRDQRFDIVFSSNMLEHVPNPQRVLQGIRARLTEDGLTIHVMPNALWKLFHIVLFMPATVLVRLEQIRTRRQRGRDVDRSGRHEPRDSPAIVTTPGAQDDTLKGTRRREPLVLRLFVPEPHGVAPTNLQEFSLFTRRRWLGEFRRAGLRVVRVMKGPVASGYGFGFDRIRSVLERMGVTTEYVYVAVREGAVSKYERLF